MTKQSDQMQYYEEELKSLAEAVKKCDVVGITDAFDFFIEESNASTAGLDTEVQDRLKYYTRKIKQNCMCKER